MTTSTQQLSVRKRDGRVVSLDRALIEKAMTGAFHADQNLEEGTSIDGETMAEINAISDLVINEISPLARRTEGVPVERIQDAVELQLMKRAHYTVARRYIVYREEHQKRRSVRGDLQSDGEERQVFHVTMPDGSRQPFDVTRIRQRLQQACRGFENVCNVQELMDDVFTSIFDGITPNEIDKVLTLAARSRIERDPAHGTVAARLLLRMVYREALEGGLSPENFATVYREQFKSYVRGGVERERLATNMLDYDLGRLAEALQPQRDGQFTYLGLQTIYDRYLVHWEGRRVETPQYFWMRVAMGLASCEGEQKHERAIQFYNILSTFRFTSATPTLFNSGTLHPQLSSCYLSTVADDLNDIFKVVGDNARLSKWAGGLGNDWTCIRATGSYIKGTHGQSQGVIPFLKIVNDTAVAVNQGGKRKGAVCSYLESWHLDIEEFLDLRKNTGDDRRRTHDMHTANWIPDLFMKRVQENKEWTLFSPNDVPDLHDLVGKAFEARYTEYEKMAEAGTLKLFKKTSAVGLWRKMLTRVFETGHPWITFKDPSNIRSPQDHVGVVHSSNLCTEILLNTSQTETAVCNLGSVNLRTHLKRGKLDLKKLEETVRIAVRMLDNVIDINYYPTPEAANSNSRHRPVGMGLMGFQDALYELGISYASKGAVEFADHSMEAISYYAILASSELAKERGPYSTYKGSKWDRGLLPIDTIDLLESERGVKIDVDRSAQLDWDVVRKSIAENGIRNSNIMAIAPTATISTIIGVTQSIEPTYKNLYVKSNLSGDFTQINSYLVNDLKKAGLWDYQMLDELKYYDGELGQIDRIPVELQERYKTAFEVEAKWLIDCAARRQKWIDMGQSLNLYLCAPSGKKLHDMYTYAWKTGLKTTYYLRSLGATQIEKSTLDVNKYGVQPRWMKNKSESARIVVNRDAAGADGSDHADGEAPSATDPDDTAILGKVDENGVEEMQLGEAAPVPTACSIDNPDCEACQ